jgi:DNA polymerase (family 10)
MKNLKIAKILKEIAILLEMKGVEFKPRAYRKAANAVRSLSKDIENVKEKGNLKDLPGVGESIAEKIEELIETGSLEYYEELKKEYPVDLESLMAVEGLGPKTIKLLYEELGIKNLDDLEKAAKENKIRELEGMGEKTENSILDNIEFARKKTNRSLLGYTLPIAESLKEELKDFKYIERIEIAGSLRRKKVYSPVDALDMLPNSLKKN